MTNHTIKLLPGLFELTGGDAHFTHEHSTGIWHDLFIQNSSSLTQDSKVQDFLLPYVLLQITIEVRFHFLLGKILHTESKNLDEKKRKAWQRKYVHTNPPKSGEPERSEKLDYLRKVLTEKGFHEENISNIQIINKELIKLNGKRNSILHGHSISTSSQKGDSELKKILNFETFEKTVHDVQKNIVEIWNTFIFEIALQNIDKKVIDLPQSTEKKSLDFYQFLDVDYFDNN